MQRVLLLVALCFLSMSTAMSAQDDSLSRGGAGGFWVGYGTFDIEDLQVFVPTDFPTLSNNFLLFGGGGYGNYNNFLLGGSGQGLIGKEESTDSLSASVNAGMGFLNLGYMVVHNEDFRLFPMVGIGFGGVTMHLAENGVLTPETIVAKPGNETQISQGGLMLDFSASVELMLFKEQQRDGSWGGMMLGLTAGYLLSPQSNDWSYTGGEINGGPDFGLSGFYARLSIGGYGYEAAE